MKLILLIFFISSLITTSTTSSTEQYLLNKINLNNLKLPSPVRNVNAILYHQDSVYLAADNWLLQLNASSLALLNAVRYGDDSSVNFNKLLLLYSKERALLTCWSLHGGVCDLRRLSNLELLRNSTISVVASDYVNSTIGLIAPAANSDDLLYVAVTYSGGSVVELPALAGRSLKTHDFMHVKTSSQGLKSIRASIQFLNLRIQQQFLVHYVHSFHFGVFNYFLQIQKMDYSEETTESGIPIQQSKLITKISRICTNDLSFTRSYIEMPLQCGDNYNELQSAQLIQRNSQFYLLGLFQRTLRTNFNQTVTRGEQALCLFSLKEIQLKFRDNLNRCFNSDPDEVVMRGLSFIKPDQKCFGRIGRRRFEQQQQQVDEDFCSSSENGLYPIGGQLPLKSNKPLITFSNEYLVSILFSSQSKLLFMSSAQKLEMFHFQNKLRKYQTVELGEDISPYSIKTIVSPMVSPMALDSRVDPPNLFLISKRDNSLQLLSSSPCHLYKTCSECSRQESLCGWCVNLNKCTAQSQCHNQWLNTTKLCVDIVRIEPQVQYLNDQSQSIVINFRGQLLGTNDYKCLFNEYQKTKAMLLDSNRLKCSLPALDNSKFISDEENNFKEKDSDGIFYKNTGLNEENKFAISIPVSIEEMNKNQLIQVYKGQGGHSQLVIYNCDSLRSCVSCFFNSKMHCEWENNKCIKKRNGLITEQDQIEKCSSFSVRTNKLLIPFSSPNRKQIPLQLNLLNVNDETMDLECFLVHANVTLKFQRLNATVGRCSMSSVFDLIKLQKGQLQTSLRLFNKQYQTFIDSNGQGRLSLLFYNCEEMTSSSCADCLSIDPQMSCLWCHNKCRFVNKMKPENQQQCISSSESGSSSFLPNPSQCDRPQLLRIEPSKFPLSTVSSVQVHGRNLNLQRIVLAEVVCSDSPLPFKCDLVQKVTSGDFLQCLLNPVHSIHQNCHFRLTIQDQSLNVVSSSQQLSFVEPLVSRVQPQTVIQSATSVWLTLNGFHLDTLKQRKFILIGDSTSNSVHCEIKNCTENTLRCRINEKFKSLGKKSIFLFEKGDSLATLRVQSDPLIQSIDKWTSIYSGGTRFHLLGYNLAAVQSAYCFLTYEQWYSEPVAAVARLGQDRVAFEFPALSESFFHLIKSDAKNSSFPLQIGFLLDGYNRTLTENSVIYEPDPILLEIIEIEIKMESENFILEFQMNSGNSRNILIDQLDVFIGCSKCHKLKWISSAKFICQLPHLNRSSIIINQKVEEDSSSFECEQRVFRSFLLQLEKQNRFRLIQVLYGNYLLKDTSTIKENLEIYLNTFKLNQKQSMATLMGQLTNQAQETSVNHQLLENLRDQQRHLQAATFYSSEEPIPSSKKRIFFLISFFLTIILLCVSFTIIFIFLKRRKNQNKEKQLVMGNRLNKFPNCLQIERAGNSNASALLLIQQMQILEDQVRSESDLLRQQLLIEMNLWDSQSQCHNYNLYLQQFLFPKKKQQQQKIYATLRRVVNNLQPHYLFTRDMGEPIGCKVLEAMHYFDELIHNRNFLLAFLGIVEDEPLSSIEDKAYLASLITLCLKDHLPVLYSIVQETAKSLIRKKAQEDQEGEERQLFLNSNSIAECLVHNWLSLFLFDFAQDDCHCSLLLLRLHRALQLFIDCGPVDQLQNRALHSLNEDFLLINPEEEEQHFDLLIVNVLVNGQIPQQQQCRLVSTDSVQQMKEKLLKNLRNIFTSSSQFDVELLIPNEESVPAVIPLIEEHSERILTIKDLNVQSGSYLNVRTKEDQQHIYMEQSDYSPGTITTNTNNSSTNQRQFHLLKSSNFSSSSGSSSSATGSINSIEQQQLMMSNSKNRKNTKKYEKLKQQQQQNGSGQSSTNKNFSVSLLKRLLLNKSVVQPLFDDLINSIFSNTGNLPPIVQHLFEFFDSEWKEVHKNNSNLMNLKCSSFNWKVNCYFRKYWLHLFQSNDALFYQQQSNYIVDASLFSLTQAFADACVSFQEDQEDLFKGMKQPLNKLLFLKDTVRYKQMLKHFFAELNSLQKISNHELHFYFNEFSKESSTGTGKGIECNRVRVLLQLHQLYYEKHEKQINGQLRQQHKKEEYSVMSPVHKRLVKINDLMMSQTQSPISASTQQSQVTSIGRLIQQQQQQQFYQTLSFQQTQNQQDDSNPYQQPCYSEFNQQFQ